MRSALIQLLAWSCLALTAPAQPATAADAVKFCPDVQIGEQRVLNCLASHRDELDRYCSLALSDIGK